jgi:NADH dehydrogenase
VIHLAAATGASGNAQLEAVNIRGTAALLQACLEHNVRRFIYMSSIAANCTETGDYPYGASKQRAEALVRESGLPYVIVRPTIVLGEKAANWPMLRKLAGLPVVPLIGGGTARVQPVDVADVAAGIRAIVDSPDIRNTAIDLGGPEVLSFAEFLRRIRAASGKDKFPHLRIPVWPLRLLLKTLAAVFGARLPVSPGQLAPFTTDGVAMPHPLTDRLRAQMRPLDELLRSLVDDSGSQQINERVLAAECGVFTRYLSSSEPDAYVVRKYIQTDAVVSRLEEPGLPVDGALLAFAAAGPVRTRIADAYARMFRPTGLLRRKLVATLAILENSPAHHGLFTRGSPVGAIGAAARIALSIAAFAFALGVGLVLFGPRQILSGSPKAP